MSDTLESNDVICYDCDQRSFCVAYIAKGERRQNCDFWFRLKEEYRTEEYEDSVRGDE